MKIILRNTLAVIVGLVLGSLANMALVMVGPHVVPPPPGVNMNDMKSLAEGVHRLTPAHFLFPFLAHVVGTLVGAMVTHLAAATHRTALAFVIGALFLTGGILAATMIPSPTWFIALDIVVAYLPMAWLGIVIARRLHPETPVRAA